MTEQTPRWLSEEQTQAWIALASMMVWLPSALDDQLERDAGMTYVEYTVLSWLSMQPGRTSRMSDVASLANVSASHLTRIAIRLESRGWLTRRPDPNDGRATLATLTEAGWEKVVQTAPGHVEEVQQLVFDGLSAAQVRQLRVIGETVAKAARPGLCLPSPGPTD